MTDFGALLKAADRPDLRPDDRQLEEALTVGLLADPQTGLRILERVSWKEFTHPHTRHFASLVWPSLKSGATVDPLIFRKLLEAASLSEADREEVRNFAQQVFQLVESDPPPAGKIEAYLSLFIAEADRRNVARMLQQGYDLLADPAASAAEVAGDLSRLVFELDPARRLSGGLKSEGDSWGAYMQALEARQRENEFLGLDTGWGHLNNVANGLEAGSLFVLGAAPSTGKTTWVKQLVDQVATLNSEAACLFVSYEQSADELRIKTLSRLSGLENRDLIRGRLTASSPGWAIVKKVAQDYRSQVADRVFILEADNRMTIDRIRLAAEAVTRLTNCRQLLVAVDYLQIVPTDREYSDPRSKVDAVLSDMRRLARDLKATVLTIASIGRASYANDTGRLEAFKESGNVEYTADLAGLLIEDKTGLKGHTHYPAPGSGSRDWKRVYLDIVKNRNGERSRIHFDFFPAVSGFTEGNRKPEVLPEDPAPNYRQK